MQLLDFFTKAKSVKEGGGPEGDYSMLLEEVLKYKRRRAPRGM